MGFYFLTQQVWKIVNRIGEILSSSKLGGGISTGGYNQNAHCGEVPYFLRPIHTNKTFKIRKVKIGDVK